MGLGRCGSRQVRVQAGGSKQVGAQAVQARQVQVQAEGDLGGGVQAGRGGGSRQMGVYNWRSQKPFLKS